MPPEIGVAIWGRREQLAAARARPTPGAPVCDAGGAPASRRHLPRRIVAAPPSSERHAAAKRPPAHGPAAWASRNSIPPHRRLAVAFPGEAPADIWRRRHARWQRQSFLIRLNPYVPARHDGSDRAHARRLEEFRSSICRRASGGVSVCARQDNKPLIRKVYGN